MVKIQDLHPDTNWLGTWKGYLDGNLAPNLDLVIENVTKKDFDFVLIIDGKEGGGKSVLGQHIAKYLDAGFSAENICFKPEQLIEQVNKRNKGECIVFDEAMSGMGSRSAMSSINKTLNNILFEVRQKNLYLILILPTFFELDKVPALWRSEALIHVYLGKGMKRGFYAFYNYSKKIQLYVKGKKFFNYRVEKPNFCGVFTKGYTVDETKYRDMKRQALTEHTLNAKVSNDGLLYEKQTRRLGVCLEWLNKTLKIPQQIIADKLNLNVRTIQTITRAGREGGVPNDDDSAND